ncbi:MAG: helix-turn-helix domain-containing protein, partial [Actinomycetota bacterium]|nr:helix-turn-helix domain-containing protein [Actinomycetota bacterium]
MLGERVRQLRIAAGITQTDLAGDRFSKEYVSQIERAKTRPTRETVAWLAERLNVDESFLVHGVSSSERDRLESVIAQAEAVLESHDYVGVLPHLEGMSAALARAQAPELEVRALRTEAWARMYVGEVREAMRLLERARTLAEEPVFTDVDRADILFRLGACRYNLSSIGTAVSLLTQALELADGSSLPCDRLRSLILEWRSRCYQRQRDWEAAREDIERALELAQGVDDRYALAQAYFQASLV